MGLFEDGLPDRPLVIAADQADQQTLHLHFTGPEDAGFIGGVRRLKRDRAALFAQGLQRGFFVMDEGDDDIAGGGGVGAFDDHQIAVQDAFLDHRVAIDLESEMLAARRSYWRAR
jgi:competence protein ComEC